MAQRTIHYLFAELVSAHISLHDKERFMVGCLLPDAAQPDERDAAHFKVRTDSQIFYDFDAFREDFRTRLLQDDLYLGYYLHLITDAFYRAFIYCGRFSMPRTREEVQVLHRDYHLLNAYIVRKYGIHSILPNAFSLENEPICGIARFLINGFLAEAASDFAEQPNGTTVFLTEDMLDEFVEIYVPLAAKEIVSLQNGMSALRAADYAWMHNR